MRSTARPSRVDVTPAPPAPAGWSEYRRLSGFVRPHALRLVVILILSLAATALGLAQPYFSKLLIDAALLRHDFRALCWVAGLILGGTITGFLLNILCSYQYVRVSAAMLFEMRLALYRHLQTLSPRFYAKWRLGDLVSRLNTDVGEVQRVSADSLLSVLSNVVFLVGSVVMMLWLNARLFAVSVLLVPLCLYSFRRYQGKLGDFTRELRERGADLGSLFVETLLGIRLVVCSNAGRWEEDRFRERNTAFVDTLLKLQMTSFLTGALPGAILTASTALVFLYGGWMAMHGQTTIGTLFAFMAYHTRLLAPIQNLMSMAAGLTAARVSLSRIFEILDTPPEVVDRPDAQELGPVRGHLAFEDVTLRHDRENVLESVSFQVPAGTFCAVLGSSGAGKSTIADLTVRLIDPDGGRITLDGVDLRDLRLQDLRREVLLVDQTPYLLNGTIAENIAYACPNASPEAVEDAGRRAGLDELIARLPEGYQTRAGERGLALSAGERQRIALSRALLRKPSVLVLDEPTSALDPETERFVAANLRAAMAGRTVILITHRPALAELADMVITVRDGKTEMRLAAV